MGDFTEHILFGFLSAAVISYFVKDSINMVPVESFLASIAIIVGSVLPDIDHKKAYVHRAVKAFVSLGAGAAMIVYLPLPVHLRFTLAAAVFLLIYITFSVIKIRHRGFTHSLTFLAIVASLGVIASVYTVYSVVPGIALGIGIFSHLVLDGEFKIE
ncbi:MAG: metal-dependent hydrolase [Candidatus Nanohaloarchaea archaeon]